MQPHPPNFNKIQQANGDNSSSRPTRPHIKVVRKHPRPSVTSNESDINTIKPNPLPILKPLPPQSPNKPSPYLKSPKLKDKIKVNKHGSIQDKDLYDLPTYNRTVSELERELESDSEEEYEKKWFCRKKWIYIITIVLLIVVATGIAVPLVIIFVLRKFLFSGSMMSQF